MNSPGLIPIYVSDLYFTVTSLSETAATDSIPFQFHTKSNLIQYDLVEPVAVGH